MTEDEWRNRVPVVTTFDLCPECNELKPDVKERTYFYLYMQTKATCCSACFVKRDEPTFDFGI